ncbi:hypothetical protein PZA11_000242 [Diplocarpon coronariae]
MSSLRHVIKIDETTFRNTWRGFSSARGSTAYPSRTRKLYHFLRLLSPCRVPRLVGPSGALLRFLSSRQANPSIIPPVLAGQTTPSRRTTVQDSQTVTLSKIQVRCLCSTSR